MTRTVDPPEPKETDTGAGCYAQKSRKMRTLRRVPLPLSFSLLPLASLRLEKHKLDSHVRTKEVKLQLSKHTHSQTLHDHPTHRLLDSLLEMPLGIPLSDVTRRELLSGHSRFLLDGSGVEGGEVEHVLLWFGDEEVGKKRREGGISFDFDAGQETTISREERARRCELIWVDK